MKLWTYKWFQNLINYLRGWAWFDFYIYGKSVDLEDFVRNPAEILRNYFPFTIKNVKAISIFNLRCGYRSALNNSDKPNCWLVPMGKRAYIWEGKEWVYSDLRIWNPFYTKYCNAMFFIQLATPFYISMCIKIAPWYFQFGFGWAGEVQLDGTFNGVLCGKFRFVNERTSNEAILNPTDILGYYEGTI